MKIDFMIKKLQQILLILCGAIILTACQKELNFADSNTNTPGSNSGTAMFSYAGGTGACAAAIFSGTYNKGTILNSLNTVTVKVKVDSIGTYTIATANINGIIFSATGNFTSIGEQTIILKAAGTPLASGSFIYTPGASGCSFAITVTANGSTSGTAQFTLNGAPDSCTTPKESGNYFVGVALNAADSVIIKATVTTPGSYTITTNAVNGIIFTASGTFAASGQFTVTLIGAGKPNAAGGFSFTPGTGGCKFAINFITQPVSFDCKECTYLPVCVGSKYQYSDTVFTPNFLDTGFTSQTSLRKVDYISSADTIIDGRVFKKIGLDDGISTNYSYTNCFNGQTTVLAYNLQSTTYGNVLTAFNTIELKANAGEGTSWKDTSVINAVNYFYNTHTIIKKGIGRTLLGVAYNNVILVRVDASALFVNPPLGLVSEGYNEYYIAKGIGLIETIGYIPNPVTNKTYLAYHSVIKSYFIP